MTSSGASIRTKPRVRQQKRVSLVSQKRGWLTSEAHFDMRPQTGPQRDKAQCPSARVNWVLARAPAQPLGDFVFVEAAREQPSQDVFEVDETACLFGTDRLAAFPA